MAKAACSDEEFIKLFREHGSLGTAKILGVSDRSVRLRRRNLERLISESIPSPVDRGGSYRFQSIYPKRLKFDLKDGVAIVGSDCHYWPEMISPAHRAYVRLSRELKAALQLLNGDVVDGPTNSRHARIGWQKVPTVKEEKEAVLDRLSEIEEASPQSERFWLLGNHDARFENRLSDKVPEYEGVSGFKLQDHFPRWRMGVSLWINDEIVVKHRFKGGIHATHNNTLWSGKTMVTGHLHSLKVTPFDDYDGTRWGVDTGTMADPYGPQFEYSEDNPLNHRSGFVVLTFKNGKLLWPEICAVVDENHVQFRGEIFSV